ncbi:porin [Thalassovita sp.]|uniref:porin n=1 Tax=Thalassovita sp. TaxID=1979401 RepID=UPI0029DE54A6|nr:porin [Thalassovita sp.]
MKKNLLIACAFTMATFAAAAQAETVFSGDLGFSAGVNSFSNSDDSEEASESTFSLNGNVRADMGVWAAFADFNYVRRDVPQDDWDDYLPEGASSLGLHFGRHFNDVYAGAFIGKNWFQGDDSSSGDGYVDGTLWGVEAEYMLSPNTALFGQIGMADMVGDDGDSEFDGHFVRIGMAHTVNKLTLAMDYEFGRSPDIFEDSSDWGEYKAFTVSAEYQFKPRLIGTFSLSQMDITANTEDSGDETVVEVGLKIPFGATYKRNNLTTTYRPGLAAAWAETLD